MRKVKRMFKKYLCRFRDSCAMFSVAPQQCFLGDTKRIA